MSGKASWRGSLWLGVTLSLGAAILWAVVGGWVWTVLSQLRRTDDVHRQIVVLHDGTPLIFTQHTYGTHRYYESSDSYETLDGTKVEVDRHRRLMLQGGSLSGPPRRKWLHVRPHWPQRLNSFQDGQERPVYWYFIDDGNLDGRGYFVGYHSVSKALVGYISTKGFSQTMPTEEACFHMNRRQAGGRTLASADYYYSFGRQPYQVQSYGDQGRIPSWVQHVLTADGLFHVDLMQRSVTKVVDDKGLIAVAMSAHVTNAAEDDSAEALYQMEQFVVLRTSDEIRMIDREGTSLKKLSLPEKLRHCRIRVYWTGDDDVLLTVEKRWQRDGRREEFLYWLAPDGNITREETVVLDENDGSTGQWETLAAGAIVPVPAGWAAALFGVLPVSLLFSGEASGYGDALGWSLTRLWPGLLLTILLAVVAAWLCIRRQRQYAARRTALWVTLIVLFGPAVLLAYLVHRAWAARLACPACDRPTPRDRDTCFACDKPLPRPAALGIEVFAS